MVVCEPFVALITAISNPLLEGLSHERVDYVGDILARHLLGLPSNWECIDNNPKAEPKIEDIVEGEALVLWHRDMLDGIAMERLKKIKLKMESLPS